MNRIIDGVIYIYLPDSQLNNLLLQFVIVRYFVPIVLWKKIYFKLFFYHSTYPMLQMEWLVNLKVGHEHERSILGIDYAVDLLE